MGINPQAQQFAQFLESSKAQNAKVSRAGVDLAAIRDITDTHQ